MSSNKIVLVSSDNESFEIDESVARELKIIANMIEDDCAGRPIPITNVEGKTLAKVIEYCKYHVEAEKDSEALKTWDAEFMEQFDQNTLFGLILAANYLNVQNLLDLTCQAVADLIKDKSPEEVRTIFNIENDFTEQEEAELREEHKWAFEQ